MRLLRWRSECVEQLAGSRPAAAARRLTITPRTEEPVEKPADPGQGNTPKPNDALNITILRNLKINDNVMLEGSKSYVIMPTSDPPAASHSQRPGPEGLGFFVRVGRNDHVELLHLIGTGEEGIFGFVIDAHNVERHHELITEARRHNFDVILDPKIQQMGFPGRSTDGLGGAAVGSRAAPQRNRLRWQRGSAARSTDRGSRREQRLHAALGPTHLLPTAPMIRGSAATSP